MGINILILRLWEVWTIIRFGKFFLGLLLVVLPCYFFDFTPIADEDILVALPLVIGLSYEDLRERVLDESNFASFAFP